MLDEELFDDDIPLDPQLLRAAQLDTLREEYARLWRAAADLDRIHELERLLERLLISPEPLEMPGWLVLGENGPLYSGRMLELWTRLHLIDPALKARGWGDTLVRREEPFIDYRTGTLKRVDYALRIRRGNGRLLLVALIEAKHEGLSSSRGLEQVKNYAVGRHERIPFVFSTNGYHYVEFNRRTKVESGPYPLDLFPTPDDLAERFAQQQYVVKR